MKNSSEPLGLECKFGVLNLKMFLNPEEQSLGPHPWFESVLWKASSKFEKYNSWSQSCTDKILAS